MQVQIVTLRYASTLGGFDDRELQSVLSGRDVQKLETHFFRVNDVPHVSFVVSFQHPPLSDGERAATAHVESSHSTRKPRATRDRHMEGLNEAGRALYSTLRSWRAETARNEGVPAYVVFTNKELASIAASVLDSVTALGNLLGIGKGQHAAAMFARRLLRRHDRFLKMDIRQCFPSVRPDVVMETLTRMIKDKRVLKLCRRIVEAS